MRLRDLQRCRGRHIVFNYTDAKGNNNNRLVEVEDAERLEGGDVQITGRDLTRNRSYRNFNVSRINGSIVRLDKAGVGDAN
jgi:hypothetical protein